MNHNKLNLNKIYLISVYFSHLFVFVVLINQKNKNFEQNDSEIIEIILKQNCVLIFSEIKH